MALQYQCFLTWLTCLPDYNEQNLEDTVSHKIKLY